MGELYDVIIIGGGPAGLTAALYLARAKCRVLVLEKGIYGGQIAITQEVVNYPGIARIDGAALGETMREQAAAFGAAFLCAEAQELDMSGDIKTVRTTQGTLHAFGILLAAGAQPRQIGFRGEREFLGRGVSYCATCDGAFYAGMAVFVIGGGYAAAQEAVFLTRFAKHITVLIRKDDFSCAEAVAANARNHPKITVLPHAEVSEVLGDTFLRAIRWRDNRTGEVSEYRAKDGDRIGVFVFAGYAPVSELVRGIAALDERGGVITDGDMKTNVEGLYAAGDVRAKSLRQVITAASDGALAAAGLEKHAAALRGKTGLRPELPGTEE